MDQQSGQYAARLEIEYPEALNRLTTLLRPLWAIPIIVVVALLSGMSAGSSEAQAGSLGIAGGLFLATVLMIVFRQRYPRWWFDFAREFTRLNTRIWAYLTLMTDQYPSTEDQQTVALELDYPMVEEDLNRWLPLVKWALAIPHWIIIAVLFPFVAIAVLISWVAILITGSYPRPLFDFVLGYSRVALRAQSYALLLLTDRYPPFSLK